MHTALAPERPGTPRRALSAPLMRDVLGIALPTGAFALSFGALSVASGFTVAQTCVLSLLMFTGGSQFALVTSIGAGGAPPTAAAVAVLLGGRNALYGLRLSTIVHLPPLRRALAAHLVIDESAAMAAAQDEPAAARAAFWATGISLFTLWNLGTLLGALAGGVLPDPATLGLNTAAPAAFLALIAPRLTAPGARDARVTALAAAVAVLVLVPFTPIGVPVVAAALAALALGLRIRPAADTQTAGAAATAAATATGTGTGVER